jgi:hypothetical protein
MAEIKSLYAQKLLRTPEASIDMLLSYARVLSEMGEWGLRVAAISLALNAIFVIAGLGIGIYFIV